MPPFTSGVWAAAGNAAATVRANVIHTPRNCRVTMYISDLQGINFSALGKKRNHGLRRQAAFQNAVLNRDGTQGFVLLLRTGHIPVEGLGLGRSEERRVGEE